LTTRLNQTCQVPVELSYYSAPLGPVDICAQCASPGADPKTELKKSNKTVLPICVDCEAAAHTATVARPYGKSSGKK